MQSCASNNALYCKIFPDFKIPKSYEISSSKVMYLKRYWINPYFEADSKMFQCIEELAEKRRQEKATLERAKWIQEKEKKL